MRISDWSSDGCSYDLARFQGWIWPQILSHRAVAEPDRESLWAEQLNPRQLPCPHQFCDERRAHGQARVRRARHSHRDESDEKLCRPPAIAMAGPHDGLTIRNRATVAHTRRGDAARSEEHTSELQSLIRISYAVFSWQQKKTNHYKTTLRN